MKTHHIHVKYKKPFRITTQSKHQNPISPNLLKRDFAATKPNEKWVSDISYIPTQTGFLYLAVIIDLYSRMVVGMSMSSSLSRHVILNAFSQDCLRRNRPQRVLFHSDRGIQYTSDDFRAMLLATKAIQSMSAKGNCWDNAVSESFFGTLKREVMLDRKSQNKEEAKTVLFDYIETFYNRKRKHSTLGYLPPLEFEKRFNQQRGFVY
jgi:putative transposase